MQVGEVILKFNGDPIEKFSDLPRRVGNTKPGNRITLSIWRKGAGSDVDITVAESEQAKSDNTGRRKEVSPMDRPFKRSG